MDADRRQGTGPEVGRRSSRETGRESGEETGRGIVVGYDGSDFAMQALDWAMDEAEFRRAPITVCHAWRSPYTPGDEEARKSLHHAAEHVLWHGAECARQCTSGVRVREDLFEGQATERLVALSATAGLVVVGSRGLSGSARRVMGSVAGHVATYAHCPVIVVRGVGSLPHPRHPGPIVAGVGGGDDHVLAFAYREAALRGLSVIAVRAMRHPAAVWSAGMAPMVMSDVPGRETVELLEAAVRPWRERYPHVETALQPVSGPVLDVLADASSGATMLVVGATREKGALARLGSVTRALIDAVTCPVAVVHP
ncbi:universal stress protein [Microbispora triticiradicis]|uniref:universal stress protein n=1 Tax=Microbispora triticiradicis TaxID=2200763 RepID=UPI001AD79B21|nr:universal stress protein [Microbispora triticiradicis]MBO4275800.1 universal stress protein [Microbispora triticiradicis]